MEENNKKNQEVAKRIIKKALKRIISQKQIKVEQTVIPVDITDKNEIRRAVEMQIVAPLTYGEDESKPKISDNMYEEIKLVMNLFNDVYDDAYKESYEFAKRIIKSALNKIINQKQIKVEETVIPVDIADENEIRRAVEMQIVAPVTYSAGETVPKISDNIYEEIKLVMNLFNEVYDDAYNEYLLINKKIAERNVKIDSKKTKDSKTIQQKADEFNQLIRNFRKGIPKEYLEPKREKINNICKDERNNNIYNKEIKYMPMYKGEINKLPPKKRQGDIEMGDR